MKIKKYILSRITISIALMLLVLMLFNSLNISHAKETISSNLFINLKYCAKLYKDTINKSYIIISSLFHSNNNIANADIINSEEYQKLAREALILKDENEELKKLLNIVSQIPTEKTSAEVIFMNNSMYKNNIKVRLNNTDIVKQGNIAINHEGLVGRVIDVDGHYANIMLITDFASRVAVKSTQNSTKAILIGKNSKISELSYFEKHPEIDDGNLFVTLDDGNSFVSGVPVATVEKYHNGKFYTKPVVNFDKLNYISILSVKN